MVREKLLFVGKKAVGELARIDEPTAGQKNNLIQSYYDLIQSYYILMQSMSY